MVCISLLKDSRFETQDELTFQFESKGRKKLMSQFKILSGRKNSLLFRGGSVFCTIQAFN